MDTTQKQFSLNRNAAKANSHPFITLLALIGFCLGLSAPAADNPLPELNAADLQKVEAAIPAKASVKGKKGRKLLVFYRCEGFVHGGGIVAANKAIELTAKKTGAFTVDFSTDYAVFDAANLGKYDAIVLNNTTQLKIPDANKKQALLNFVKNGKGLVGIHAATDNFYDWPEAATMVGGLFDGHPWGGGGTWGFKLDEPKHKLNRAFQGKNFKVKDEVYQFKAPYTRADRRVLISLDLSDPATGEVKNGIKRTDNDFAVAWIKNCGKGRVFFSNLGHDKNIFQEAPILQFYLDGIQYAFGDLKADATPKVKAANSSR